VILETHVVWAHTAHLFGALRHPPHPNFPLQNNNR